MDFIDGKGMLFRNTSDYYVERKLQIVTCRKFSFLIKGKTEDFYQFPGIFRMALTKTVWEFPIG